MPPLPSTVTTTEKFPGSVEKARRDREIELRIKAGAISARFDKPGASWILTTVWNVIGGNSS
jgi:hypothetical protein